MQKYRLVDSIIDTSRPVEEWRFHLDEIRVILMRINRYLNRPQACSVWEHSLRVADEASARGPHYLRDVIYARALWHDGSEAFTGDIPGPIKPLLGRLFREQEARLQQAVYRLARVHDDAIIAKYGVQTLVDVNAIVHAADTADAERETEQNQPLFCHVQ